MYHKTCFILNCSILNYQFGSSGVHVHYIISVSDDFIMFHLSECLSVSQIVVTQLDWCTLMEYIMNMSFSFVYILSLVTFACFHVWVYLYITQCIVVLCWVFSSGRQFDLCLGRDCRSGESFHCSRWPVRTAQLPYSSVCLALSANSSPQTSTLYLFPLSFDSLDVKTVSLDLIWIN